MIYLTVIIVLGLVAALFYFRNQKTIYVSEVSINKPFDLVWNWMADPLNYERLYPHWIKKITSLGGDQYQVDDQFGNSYPITRIINKDNGVIDLKIGAEISRCRLFALKDNSTSVIHLAQKWEGIGSVGWFFHKLTTDRDLKNTKKIIESEGEN